VSLDDHLDDDDDDAVSFTGVIFTPHEEGIPDIAIARMPQRQVRVRTCMAAQSIHSSYSVFLSFSWRLGTAREEPAYEAMRTEMQD
jgi:hypothetical protein